MNTTYEEVSHTACETVYKVQVDQDEPFRVRLWIIVGGLPALTHEYEGYYNVWRYPVHPLYAIDQPWLGFYPHQELIVPGNSLMGVVRGPGVEVLPNEEADLMLYIESTYAEFLVAKARRTELRELLGHGYWGIIKSGAKLVRLYEGDLQRHKVRLHFDLHAYVYSPHPKPDCDTHDEYIDNDQHDRIIDLFPIEWRQFAAITKEVIGRNKTPDRPYGPRWWELCDEDYNRIIIALKGVIALGRSS